MFYNKRQNLVSNGVNRVRAGKRMQATRVRSSCFGSLGTLQQPYLESKRELSLWWHGWWKVGALRVLFCFLFFLRGLNVFFCIVFFSGNSGVQESVCSSSGSGKRLFIFLTKKQWEFWSVCQAPIVYAKILPPTASLHCVSLCIGHEYALPCRVGVCSRWVRTLVARRLSGSLPPLCLPPLSSDWE